MSLTAITGDELLNLSPVHDVIALEYLRARRRSPERLCNMWSSEEDFDSEVSVQHYSYISIRYFNATVSMNIIIVVDCNTATVLGVKKISSWKRKYFSLASVRLPYAYQLVSASSWGLRTY